MNEKFTVSREQFDADLAEVISQYPDGSHEGWKADFGGFNMPGVEMHTVWMTGSPLASIKAECCVEKVGLSKQNVADGLAEFWKGMVFRHDSESHILLDTPDGIVLEAFTIHRKQFYVSIKVTVEMSKATDE